MRGMVSVWLLFGDAIEKTRLNQFIDSLIDGCSRAINLGHDFVNGRVVTLENPRVKLGEPSVVEYIRNYEHRINRMGTARGC